MSTAAVEAGSFGWDWSARGSVNWTQLVSGVQDYIHGQNFGYRTALREEGIELVESWGRLTSSGQADRLGIECLRPVDPLPHQASAGLQDRDPAQYTHAIPGSASAGDTPWSVHRTLTSKHAVIAVGGRPVLPSPSELPGVHHAITSDDLFSLPRTPGRTVVVGGGYVALETAGLLNGLGFETTLVLRSVPLRGFDSEMAGRVLCSLEAEGVRVLRGCVPASIVETRDWLSSRVANAGLRVHFKAHGTVVSGTMGSNAASPEGATDAGAPDPIDADTVVMATGRRVLTQGLGLEALGVSMEPSTGKILCYDKQRTETAQCADRANIHAIGDVVAGRQELTPVASRAGKVLARHLFSHLARSNPQLVSWATGRQGLSNLGGQEALPAASKPGQQLSFDSLFNSPGPREQQKGLSASESPRTNAPLDFASLLTPKPVGDISLDLSSLKQSAVGQTTSIGEAETEHPPGGDADGIIPSWRLKAAPWHDGTERMDYSCVPTAVFTPTEYACVGLSEDEALHRLGMDNTRVYVLEYDTLEMAAGHRRELIQTEVRARQPQAPDMPRCMLKIVCRRSPAHSANEAKRAGQGEGGDPDENARGFDRQIKAFNEDEEVLGIHVFGPGASEVMQGYAAAMSVAKQVARRLRPSAPLGIESTDGDILGMTKRELEACIGVHPTHAEEIVGAERWKGSGVSAIKSSC